jgi:arylsulfatase A-like enzyme
MTLKLNRCFTARFARQVELGVIGPNAKLATRHAEIPAWEEVPEEFRAILEHETEVHAGFLEHADHPIGRVIDAIEEVGSLVDVVGLVLGPVLAMEATLAS